LKEGAPVGDGWGKRDSFVDREENNREVLQKQVGQPGGWEMNPASAKTGGRKGKYLS